MSDSRVFEWNTIVDFADTDAGGVVYYARYFRLRLEVRNRKS